jgi:hypothetical protein
MVQLYRPSKRGNHARSVWKVFIFYHPNGILHGTSVCAASTFYVSLFYVCRIYSYNMLNFDSGMVLLSFLGLIGLGYVGLGGMIITILYYIHVQFGGGGGITRVYIILLGAYRIVQVSKDHHLRDSLF